jgi:hypothetical protein
MEALDEPGSQQTEQSSSQQPISLGRSICSRITTKAQPRVPGAQATRHKEQEHGIWHKQQQRHTGVYAGSRRHAIIMIASRAGTALNAARCRSKAQAPSTENLQENFRATAELHQTDQKQQALKETQQQSTVLAVRMVRPSNAAKLHNAVVT